MNDYTPQLFLRQAQNALLKEYFNGDLKGIVWEDLKDAEIDAIYSAWQALPAAKQEQIEGDFRDIFDLASADGVRTLIEEGRASGVDLTAEFEAVDGFLNKALSAFLKHREVFNIAGILDRADHLSNRYWHKRHDFPKKSPDLSPEAINKLGELISAYYKRSQGRGKWCKVEPYLRADGRHYFFAYPKDYTDTSIEYDDNGRFARRRRDPAFEVIYEYHPIHGTLDLYAQGDKELRLDLQKLFADAILHEEIGEENKAKPPYNLNCLKDRAMAFPTEPTDNIKGVRVREVRLAVIGDEGCRMTFQVRPGGGPSALHDLIQRAIHEERLPMSMVNVASAVIEICFGSNGNGREKVLPFRLSYPDSCNLKDRPEHRVAKKYLRIWGLERA
jgi:hypothetical protein